MATNEKTNFGASITTPSTPPPATLPRIHTSPPTDGPLLPHSTDSTPVGGDAPRGSHDVNHSNPFSAFYSHPDARRSFDGSRSAASRNASKTNLNVTVKDVEAQTPLSAATSRTGVSKTSPKASVDGRAKECTVWPSKTTLREKQKQAKKRGPVGKRWARLNKRQQLYTKIAIALFLIGVAVAIGVGITKAVGGGVWASTGNSKQIPDVNNNSAG